MTIHGAMWLVTVASIIGTVANIYQRRWCFGVWMGTNLAWAAFDAWIGAYAQATLQAVYAGLAVWGLVQWAAKARGKPAGASPPPIPREDRPDALREAPGGKDRLPGVYPECQDRARAAFEAGEDHQ